MKSRRLILGLSAYYHDSAACLLADGEILAAAQEERFTRRRFDAAFPRQAIAYCLREAGCTLDDLEQIVFYDKPFLKFDRLLETYLAMAPRGYRSFQKSLPTWLKEKLFLKQMLLDSLLEMTPMPTSKSRRQLGARLHFSEHHLSHAASAFYPSPFHEAAVLVLDGVGEWATASLFRGEGEKLHPIKEVRFPHSLGLLYSAFTSYCGFKVNSGEYKLMGLAPYGEPAFADVIRKELVHIADDGSFRLNLDYFDYLTDLKMTNAKFDRLFGGPTRSESEPITVRHMNLAASIQVVTEEILLKMTRSIARDLKSKNLCLAGGVALNCVANGKILRDGCFENLWIQPAAGDAGGALGAAFVGWHLAARQKRQVEMQKQDSMHGAFLGPAYDDGEIAAQLAQAGGRFHKLAIESLLQRASELLTEGKALGWFQGRMEFGPRSLGARSILADPRSANMQSRLNLKIKFRESFRPFAPAVLREDLNQWFDLNTDSPYMLLVADITQSKRVPLAQGAAAGFERLKLRPSQIPAVTHVDLSARVQTVHKETNPFFHRLLQLFKESTSCPVLVNTSFNVRGEPIVNTPSEAFRCFMGTDLDALVIGPFLLLKEEQDPRLSHHYHETQEKD